MPSRPRDNTVTKRGAAPLLQNSAQHWIMPSTRTMDAPAARVLRAKYYDWCSARLADRFLALSPDEIYELAERASHGREPDPDAVVASGAAGAVGTGDHDWSQRGVSTVAWREPENFRVLVARVAEVLADTLPSFETWAEAYQRAPERFEDELLGFWKENL